MNKIILAKRAKKLNIILNDILLNEINNPKLNAFSIMEVKLSNDGQIATIYVSVLGSENKKNAVMTNLERSKGYLRSLAAKSWNNYRIPQFKFAYDDTFESAHKIEELINSLEYTTEDNNEK